MRAPMPIIWADIPTKRCRRLTRFSRPHPTIPISSSWRLVIASPQLRHQIVWFFVIFTAVFLIFRLIHPAFDITTSPLVVLLAFVMLALSVLVITLISGKFEQQLLRLLREEHAGILSDIAAKKEIASDTEKKLVGVLDAFAKSFAP